MVVHLEWVLQRDSITTWQDILSECKEENKVLSSLDFVGKDVKSTATLLCGNKDLWEASPIFGGTSLAIFPIFIKKMSANFYMIARPQQCLL